MTPIGNCFNTFLDKIIDNFQRSRHPNRSRIVDQVLIIKEQDNSRLQWEILADLMEDNQ